MNKVTATLIDTMAVPTFGTAALSPDNSQNARRNIFALYGLELPDGINVEIQELTAPADAKSGPVKALCRIRASVPQIRLSNSADGMGVSTLAMTGQSDYFQAEVKVTLPPMWARVLLGTVAVSMNLRASMNALLRIMAIDALNGIFGDVVSQSVFKPAAYTAVLPSTSPLFRAAQGANPEDVFNGTYGLTPS